MRWPRLNETSRSREVVTTFAGYNHTLACREGEFFDMQNMTASHYPVLSPRDRRGIVRQLTDPSGVLDKEKLMWIDGTTLYVDGEAVDLGPVFLSSDPSMCPKTMTKMGAYVVIMPDKVWYNADDGSAGYMESEYQLASGTLSFTLCDTYGNGVDWQTPSYWETHTPTEGSYMLQTVNGATTLSVWSDITNSWNVVANTYVRIAANGIGAGFDQDDGVEITIDNSAAQWDYASQLFVNDLGDGKLSLNTQIHSKTDNAITVVGILQAKARSFSNMPITVVRKVPDMAFLTECNNRLWGCDKSGHEIYCCKLGDVKNWNSFQGISTDSWAATIGSDGVFTGAVTYNSFPMFFKEDSFIKISISSVGAHQVKETRARGVQAGSERSLVVVGEMLFFKSTNAVCAYNGSVPFSVSDCFGEDNRYSRAVAGALGDKYYISMHNDTTGEQDLFVFHSGKGLWHKEDHTDALYFCRHGDELYYIDNTDKTLRSVRGTLSLGGGTGTLEGPVEWMAQSGPIGYASPDNKYVSRVCIRMSLEFGAMADFWIRYDSQGDWEHKFNMSGMGTRSFLVPITPRRCDHFEYKISGVGGCKVYGITKTIEEGSDGA